MRSASIKKFQSFKNFRTIGTFVMLQDNVPYSLKKKKKNGEAFHSDHFLKRMVSSNIRLVLCDFDVKWDRETVAEWLIPGYQSQAPIFLTGDLHIDICGRETLCSGGGDGGGVGATHHFMCLAAFLRSTTGCQ